MELLENTSWNTILIAARQSMFKIYTMENKAMNEAILVVIEKYVVKHHSDCSQTEHVQDIYHKAKNGTYKMMDSFFEYKFWLIVLPLGVTMTGNECNWRSSLTMVTKRRRESQLQYIIKCSKVSFSHAFPTKNQISNARLSTFEELLGPKT